MRQRVCSCYALRSKGGHGVLEQQRTPANALLAEEEEAKAVKEESP